MRTGVSAQVNRLITLVLCLVIFATPLFLLPVTTEFYEFPKLVFLLVAVSVLLILRALSWIFEGKVLITRTPIDIPLLLLLIVTIASAIFSPQTSGAPRFITFFGNFPRVHGSVVSWIIYALFYFIATSHLKSRNQVKWIFYALLGSAFVAGLISLFSYFGVYMPFSLAQFANFSPTGSSFSTASLLALLLPVLLATPLMTKKFIPVPIALAFSTLFILIIALIGDLPTYVASVLGLGLLIFIKQKALKGKLVLAIAPFVLGLLVLVMSAIPTGNNPLHQRAFNFPREVQLPLNTSWVVSASSFRDNWSLGTGPSTYLFDFTQYKPASYNLTNLWNVRFDSAYNEFLQTFATVGILGLLALIFLSAVILGMGWKNLSEQTEDPLVVGLSISAITMIVLLALHPSTTVLIVSIFSLLAMLMAVQKNRSEHVQELTIGIKASKAGSNSDIGDILPIILLGIISVAVVMVLFNPWGWSTWKAVAADVHHRNALKAASTQGLVTYNELVQAENLNPRVDLYRTDLAQTNFALANAIASAKGPSQSSPSGSLTDADKQNIQTLLSQSINEGKASVVLSPLSPQNWEILASIYRQISGVAQNALNFSLDAYGHAIQRDPLNPLLRLSVGGVYYSAKNYDMAIRFFTDAVNLKPDFANGYYNLAVALRDKGSLQEAAAAAQQTVSLVDPKSPDYKTATKLLSELNDAVNKSASSSARQANGTTPPPAAQENGALQNKNLPPVDVQGLNSPPQNIATPAAVKKTNQ